MKDNWENRFNLEHTLDQTFLISILHVKYFQTSLCYMWKILRYHSYDLAASIINWTPNSLILCMSSSGHRSDSPDIELGSIKVISGQWVNKQLSTTGLNNQLTYEVCYRTHCGKIQLYLWVTDHTFFRALISLQGYPGGCFTKIHKMSHQIFKICNFMY